MQTFASTADPAASHWPADGSRLDRLDKRLSGPLFQLQLGARLEVLLSVPGCFFGMPAALAVTPSLLAAAYSGGVPPSHLALGAGVLLLAAWGVVVIGESERLALALFSMRACVVAPVVGVWLVEVHEGFPSAAKARAHLMLLSLFCALVPTLVLKKRTRRRRPVVSEVEHLGEASASAATRKSLRVIPRLLSRDTNAAFPSGDATGAAVVAFALAGASTGHRRAAVGLLVGACAGRIYWHAHHLLDVTVGAAIGLAVSATVHWALGGGAAWWHALGAEATLTAVALLVGTHKNHGKDRAPEPKAKKL